MVQMEEMRQLLCRTYPGLRDRVVATAGEWIGDGGEFIAHAWVSQLCNLVQERMGNGDYEQSDALFCVIERLLAEGDDSVRTAVSTGFLEGLQHQQRLAPELWQPLLGSLAKAHCTTMDSFYGIDS